MLNLSNLNKNQIEAIQHNEGPALCLAGAGSGKTTTLTYRVANLIEKGVAPTTILLLTFTKKASQEMLNRVIRIVGQQGKQVEGGTFHSFARTILANYGNHIGIPNKFTVLDENDSIDIISNIRHSNFEFLNDLKLPSSSNIVYQIITRARSYGITIRNTINHFYDVTRIDYKAIEFIHQEYTNYKQHNSLLDYDDLLEWLYKLLQKQSILDQISNQFRYIMIDEYQDTNLIQAQIANKLAMNHRNIMVVGDDAQSIYSFRGSRVENIKDFLKTYPDAKIIKLEENYRSFGNILKACNSLINKSTICIKKNLYTQKESGNKPIIIPCISESEEAKAVLSQIITYYKMGLSLNDMVVLFRNTNHSRELESELTRINLPFKKIGGPRFYDSNHIRDIISYLRVLNNPYDQISWTRILQHIKGIGPQKASSIYEKISTQIEPFDLSNLKEKPQIKNSLNKLSEMLLRCVKHINSNTSAIMSLITDYYYPILLAISPETKESKLSDLDYISNLANKYSNLEKLLNEMFLDPTDDLNTTSGHDKQCLTLSTIHSAKGLEWEQVFIIGATDGRFPSSNSLKNPADLEEERRLMYVAMTRAKLGLTISYPTGMWDRISNTVLTQASRFITEIDSSCLQQFQIIRN